MSKTAGRHAAPTPVQSRSVVATTAAFAGAALGVIDMRKVATATATLSVASALLLNTALPAHAETTSANSAGAAPVQTAVVPTQGFTASAAATASLARSELTASAPAPEAETTAAASKSSAASAPTVAKVAPTAIVGSSVIDTALSLLGVPYVWAGTTPSGFDCSGFVQYVFALHGVQLPHSSSAQAASGTTISADQAQPGDLVHWSGHVGIYLGGGKFVHAPKPGDVVSIGTVSTHSGSPTYIRIG